MQPAADITHYICELTMCQFYICLILSYANYALNYFILLVYSRALKNTYNICDFWYSGSILRFLEQYLMIFGAVLCDFWYSIL